MVRQIAIATLFVVVGFATIARSANFNALSAGTMYPAGSHFVDGGLDFDVLSGFSGARISAVGTSPPNPSFDGNFLNLPSNVEVAINLPTGASRIQFDFFRGYTAGGLRINGSIIPYTQIPGTINGVTVTNLVGSKTGNPSGSITAAGIIDSFAIIGTEFWVDNLVANLSADVAGDFNNNQVVDGADYVAWRKNANNPSGYSTWRANFGTTSPGSGMGTDAMSALPEPSTLTLICVLVLPLIRQPRNLRRIYYQAYGNVH